MFKLNPNPTFWVKTKVRSPGGAVSEFEVEYRHKNRQELKAFCDAAAGRDEALVMSEIVANWRGMDVDYSQENLAALLNNYSGLGGAMFGDYVSELMKAREGN